jgi:hypothetical protein
MDYIVPLTGPLECASARVRKFGDEIKEVRGCGWKV